MQQRVTFARLLAADPEVLLMDEPFAALDAMTRQVMQEELLRIHEQSRKTIVFITHSIDEALILSNRIVRDVGASGPDQGDHSEHAAERRAMSRCSSRPNTRN